MGKVLTKTMSKQSLSPAAQAVLTAFAKASAGEYVNGEWEQDDVGQLAAALSALADQVTPTTVDPRVSTIRWEIVRIARELETHP